MVRKPTITYCICQKWLQGYFLFHMLFCNVNFSPHQKGRGYFSKSLNTDRTHNCLYQQNMTKKKKSCVSSVHESQLTWKLLLFTFLEILLGHSLLELNCHSLRNPSYGEKPYVGQTESDFPPQRPAINHQPCQWVIKTSSPVKPLVDSAMANIWLEPFERLQ